MTLEKKYCLLHARQTAKLFIVIISFNPYSNVEKLSKPIRIGFGGDKKLKIG